MKYPIHYRADIDGLRALAIISVIIFHFCGAFLPSGYVGVDVFFVISGFLITKIILKEQALNNFSFTNFYLRRIRRIFPALFATLLVSFIFGCLVLTSGDMLWFSKGLHYASLQISNFFFQRTVDYFNEGRNFEPLLHTWSLGVEEQFYLLMPWVVIVLFHFGKNKKIPFYGLVVLSLISLGVSQYLISANQKIAFYSLLSRFWELGIGCLLAFANSNKFSNRTNNLLAGLGMALLALSVSIIKQASFPGFVALLPCLGAALIIFSGESQKTFLAKILSREILVFIGKISYSLYLWHLPLLVFYQEYSNQKTLNFATSAILLSVIFVISYCSWRFIETPFRKSCTPPKQGQLFKYPFFVAALCILFFATIATISKKTHGLNFRLAPSEFLTSADLDQYSTFVKGKHCGIAKKNVEFPNIEECVVGENKKNFEVAIFGDSHAGHYSSSVVNWAEKKGLSVAAFYFFSCPPLLTQDRELNKGKRCWEYREKVLQILKENTHIKYVFLGSTWIDNDVATTKNKELFRENFVKTIEAVVGMNKVLVILGRVPDFNVDVGSLSPLKCIEKNLTPLQKIIPIALPDCLNLSLDSFKQQQEIAAIMRNETAKYKNVFYLEPFPYFCDSKQCSSVKNGKLLYADKGHLNKNGSDYISASDFISVRIKSD